MSDEEDSERNKCVPGDEAIEDALGEMTADYKRALEEAMREHKEGKTIAFRSSRFKARKR